MKKIALALVACLLAFGGNAMAQKSVKLGHINSNDLMKIMPGRDSAQAVLQQEAADLEEQFKTMQAELEKRYNEYMEKQSGWTELIRNTKQRELQDMGTRIQEFQENAQKTLQQREEELLRPIIERAKKAISDVAADGGYTYVFDSGTAALLYSQDSDDIMPLVKRKLGLK
ncbi:MAG: OmpH family outer membrane protein [Bacteroidales bacterium]|nr:OmpH family outer membrane protein [Bacteroidales bacterium]